MSRMTLNSITALASQRQQLPPRMVIYGVDGIGKSTFASESPGPIFLPTEDGATRIDVPQFPLAVSWSEVIECLQVLSQQGEHDYQTLVIDSIDWAQHLCVEHVVQGEFDGNTNRFDSYGAGYKALLREMRVLIQWLDHLHKRCGMGIIMIAHSTVKTINNPSGDNYDKYQSTLIDSPSTSIWGMVKEWADIVLFMNREIMVKKDSKTSNKGKGMDTGRRLCYSAPQAAWDAKVRAGWSLPESFELRYAEFDKHINAQTAQKGTTKKAKGAA